MPHSGGIELVALAVGCAPIPDLPWTARSDRRAVNDNRATVLPRPAPLPFQIGGVKSLS